MRLRGVHTSKVAVCWLGGGGGGCKEFLRVKFNIKNHWVSGKNQHTSTLMPRSNSLRDLSFAEVSFTIFNILCLVLFLSPFISTKIRNDDYEDVGNTYYVLYSKGTFHFAHRLVSNKSAPWHELKEFNYTKISRGKTNCLIPWG